MWVWSLGWEDPLEEGMTTHFSILAWRTSRTEEPGGLPSMGSQRMGHDWSNLACTHFLILAPKSHIQRSPLAPGKPWQLVTLVEISSLSYTGCTIWKSVLFKTYCLNAHQMPGTVWESSPCFSDYAGTSPLTSRNRASVAPGRPGVWPSLCPASLRDDVRGSLAAWRIGLGKSPGVCRHCFWLEKQKHPQNSQGSQSTQGTCCPLLSAGPLLGQAAALFAGLWPRAVSVRQGTSHTNRPVKWGNCGFRWMLFLSPGRCCLGWEEWERVGLTRCGSAHRVETDNPRLGKPPPVSPPNNEWIPYALSEKTCSMLEIPSECQNFSI